MRNTLPRQPRRSARHVHPGRADRHACCSRTLRLHVGANFLYRHLRHTAFCEGREEMNSIRRMVDLMPPILKWIESWEKRAAYGGKESLVNLGGIRGGHAWRASRTPEKTDLFLDVRVPPTISMSEARRNIQQVFLELEKKHPGWGLEFETYVSVPGARIAEDHEMIQAIDANHKRVMGK